MSALATIFSRSVGQKLVMGLTGLFLVSFLLVHVSGNTLLFKDDGGVAFNEYTRFMTTNPIIRVMEWVLFAGFILHIAYAALLTRQNNKARPIKYAYKKGASKASSWFSRNMGLTGSIVMVFLVIHLVMFWGKYKFGEGTAQVTIQTAYTDAWKVKETVIGPNNQVLIESGGYVDYEKYQLLKEQGLAQEKVSAISMTEVVKESFSNIFIVLFYVLAMGLLAFHLSHGFQSAFHTLGLVHKKYTPLVKGLGYVVAVVIPLVFALMPVYYYFVH